MSYAFSVLPSDPKWYPARQALRLDPSEYEDLIIHNLYVYKNKNIQMISLQGVYVYTIVWLWNSVLHP